MPFLAHDPVVPQVSLGSSPAASFWSTNTLFCCVDVCPSVISAIGGAMAYAQYVSTAWVGQYMRCSTQQDGNGGHLHCWEPEH